MYLDDTHRAGTKPGVLAGDDQAVGTGEWDYSKILYETDANAVQEWYLHIIGSDISTTDKGLILGYQQSRTTVQAEDPEIPGDASNNMYSLVQTDLDSVSDEVMQNMEDENDEPPYDHDDYPGSDVNADTPWLQEFGVAAPGAPMAVLPGFVAQCGLLRFNLIAHSAADGSVVTGVTSLVQVHLVPGTYKGVAALPMGQ